VYILYTPRAHGSLFTRCGDPSPRVLPYYQHRKTLNYNRGCSVFPLIPNYLLLQLQGCVYHDNCMNIIRQVLQLNHDKLRKNAEDSEDDDDY